MSDEPRARSHARVEVRLEVVLGQPWGPEAAISDVWKSAAREAVEAVQRLIARDGSIRILGDPVVTAVLSTEPKR